MRLSSFFFAASAPVPPGVSSMRESTRMRLNVRACFLYSGLGEWYLIVYLISRMQCMWHF